MSNEADNGRERAQEPRHEPHQVTNLIDALMRAPPAPRPSIIVVGDEAVFGITPPRRAPD